MAKALKCDACGEFFDYDEEIDNMTKIMKTNVINETWNVRSYHVCPKCVNQIISMFEKEDEKI